MTGRLRLHVRCLECGCTYWTGGSRETGKLFLDDETCRECGRTHTLLIVDEEVESG
jgi:hypothetical protein